jgi:hypothetical protein
MLIQPIINLIEAHLIHVREFLTVLEIHGGLDNTNQPPAATAGGWNDEAHEHAE